MGSFFNTLCASGLLAITSGFAHASETALDKQLKAAQATGELQGLHSTIVDLKGQRLAQVYFSGKDERWGTALGERQHGPQTLHDLRSVTKSITGLLYGIALTEGKVPPLSSPLLDHFPEYADLRDGSARERILVEHALSMTMGSQWNENLPYSDPRNSEIVMENTTDRYRYVLEQPMVFEPGTKWTYSGGAVALIGRLITKGTGKPLEQYAREMLFDPMGITDFEWVKGKDGVASVASGLRLSTTDLAKIGEMLVHDGVYKDTHIVPKSWLQRSFQSHTSIEKGLRYGYLWYILGPENNPIVFAAGNGGQRLTLRQSIDFVTVSFAGRYNDPQALQTPIKVLEKFVVPEVQRALEQ
ncbi:serine hydrolase domain-containing protein [Flexibacterium corallicola]|uniref:serine hydrolase domain-containing protein n=1 Tax=Flexibacterium corallicola TaxID=3037259 RepID=UPI00286F4298|nr:serine hydrolase [Pseudovibrio sp. M1P-2-3]